MIFDRPYQTEAVTSIWRYFEAGHVGNPIVAMPTGTGKSVVIARFLKSVYDVFPAQRTLLLTHVKELIQQNFDKLQQTWNFAPAGIYSAGLNMKDHTKSITFAGIASVAKKWALFGKIDLVLIDECHLLSPNDATMYQSFLAGLLSINPSLKVIGFTATPWRLGHGHLTDPTVKADGTEVPSIFTDVCYDITGVEAFNRLIADGYLLPLVPKRTKTELKVDGVHLRGGEFIESELQTAVDKFELTESAMREAIEYGANRKKWLVFASGTDHADHVCDMLNMLGISAGSVHSKREGRDQTIADFRAGRLRAVVNNNVLTTGFDDPDIDMIICLRPTASAVLWVQMLGRGTRPSFAPGFDLNELGGRLSAIAASGKHNCLVMDFAANTKRLGPINDPVVPRRKGKGNGQAPIKCCDKCNNWVHISARVCNTVLEDGSVCDNVFTFESKLKQSASSDELIKGDLPIVETFKVDHISIHEHSKAGAPLMMRVTYYAKHRAFSEYVCVEHTNYARKKAFDWWRLRSGGMDPPATVAEALELVGQLQHATHLRVWINKQYPEILAVCLDGTAFGTQPSASDEFGRPEVEVRATVLNHKRSAQLADDDDIPF